MVKYYGRARSRVGSVNTTQLGLKMQGCPSNVGRQGYLTNEVGRRINCRMKVCGWRPVHGVTIGPPATFNYPVRPTNLLARSRWSGPNPCMMPAPKSQARAGGVGNIWTPRDGSSSQAHRAGLSSSAGAAALGAEMPLVTLSMISNGGPLSTLAEEAERIAGGELLGGAAAPAASEEIVLQMSATETKAGMKVTSETLGSIEGTSIFSEAVAGIGVILYEDSVTRKDGTCGAPPFDKPGNHWPLPPANTCYGDNMTIMLVGSRMGGTARLPTAIRSLRLFPGYEVVLYAGANCTGQNESISNANGREPLERCRANFTPFNGSLKVCARSCN